jgi:hypothetical protein
MGALVIRPLSASEFVPQSPSESRLGRHLNPPCRLQSQARPGADRAGVHPIMMEARPRTGPGGCERHPSRTARAAAAATLRLAAHSPARVPACQLSGKLHATRIDNPGTHTGNAGPGEGHLESRAQARAQVSPWDSE